MLFAISAAAAQDFERALKMKAAWLGWMSKHGVENSTLTVFKGARIVETFLEGRAAAPQFPLASLSKVITGSCINDLIKKGKLRADSTVAEVFKGNDLALARNSAITIAQLLTHTGGLYPDDTQSPMFTWLNGTSNKHGEVARRALGRKNQTAKQGIFTYNNENYAILGAVIEHITGRDYSNYCRGEVLSPLGVKSAGPSARFGAFAAWGGWEMTSEDFARFLAGSLGPHSAYGQDPRNRPHVTVVKNVYYGLGSFFRTGKKRNNFWHHGGLCFGMPGDSGSFYAYWGGMWGVVVAYDKCPNDKLMIDLDITLGRAAFR